MACAAAQAATIQGYVLYPNWYAKHPKLMFPQVYGDGFYEYGIAGNINGSTALGFFSNTENYADNNYWGVYGFFRKYNQTDGTYTLSTWDTWWRPTFAFNQTLSGTPSPIILRLHANMWSYAAMWEGNYNECGQTFAASGSSVTMVVVRSATVVQNVTCSIHEGGPNGPQIGPAKTQNLGDGPSDTRFIWNGGDVPTVPGQIYYVKIKAPAGQSIVLCNNEPIPDMSDAAPEGCAYHNGAPWYQTAAHADFGKAMDLGLTICSDDDGILTNLYTGKGGNGPSGTRVGQTFVARGTSLISFAAWLSTIDTTYVATLYDSVGGTQIGTAKKNRAMRAADPQVLWTWAPNECPLTPGNTYYIEVTREDGGWVTSLGHNWNPYPKGTAYANRAIQNGWDIGGTTMEEESPGSATRQTVQFTTFPAVARADRGARSLTVRWATNVASDSTVEYAAWNGPYTNTYYNSTATTNHVATITGLAPNTMYHLRVKSAASAKNPGITRDFVACTINDTPNLLSNPNMEAPPGSTSPFKPVPGWVCSGLDFGLSNGNWFGTVPPYEGSWLLQGPVNGSESNGIVYQTIYNLVPGVEYNFTCAISTWLQENNTWKYDVWNQSGRLDQVRIGIDPWGTHNPTEPNIRWTPAMYSHIRYTTVGIRHVALSDKMTVLISLKGSGGQWHIYGIDDCRFSEANPYVACGLADLKKNKPDGTMAELQGLTVTAVPSQAGAYYIQNSDRTQGIKVIATVGSAAPGSTVTVKGELQTDAQTGERLLANARFVSTSAGTAARPVFLTCRGVGGAGYGSIPGVPESTGAHNTALLVKVAGAITHKEPGGQVFYVNDGSLPGNGMRVDATRVSPSSIPDTGSTIGLAGISSRYYSGGIRPMLIVRDAGDIREF